MVQQGGYIQIVGENRNGKVILQGCERRPCNLIDLSSHVPVIHGDVNVADIDIAKSKEESLRPLHNRMGMGHLNSDDVKLMVQRRWWKESRKALLLLKGKLIVPIALQL